MGFLTIDGSLGEGGGQILRTSLSLAAILSRPVRIINIRAGRKKPGLQPQHLMAARAIARICEGRLSGDFTGSSTLELIPSDIRPGDYSFDVSEIKASAGSVNLILQTIILPLAYAHKASRVTVKGGTHVPWSPSSNYMDEVYLPVLASIGLRTLYSQLRAGYYPIGGGEVIVEISPVKMLSAIRACERPEGSFTVYSIVSNLPKSIAERQADEAVKCLMPEGIDPEVNIYEYPSPGKGTVVFILFNGGDIKAGFTGLGEKGKPAEKVAREACNECLEWWRSGAAIDKHLADQLILPLSLANGESVFTTVEATSHLMTNISIVKQFLPVDIEVKNEHILPVAVRIEGTGSGKL